MGGKKKIKAKDFFIFLSTIKSKDADEILCITVLLGILHRAVKNEPECTASHAEFTNRTPPSSSIFSSTVKHICVCRCFNADFH